MKSKLKPAGDQPKAILALNKGLTKELGHQTLLGVTGSGKTFTMANVIAAQDKPVLVIAHNKTLAAQLAQEYRDFFPDNAVHYFVSYYDYYQPEAYVVASDTYIEKDASINEEIERLRHASTQALLTRRDVVIVASVSCIYGLGSPSEYAKSHLFFKRGDQLSRSDLIRRLVEIYYERTNADLLPGQFRAIGNSVEVMPPGERAIVNIKIEGDKVAEIIILDAVSRAIVRESKETFFFPAKHFITQEDERNRAIISIKAELEKRLVELNKEGKILEAERLKRRTNYDLAMIREVGYCNGIENYSRHLSGRAAGEAPATLLDYFPRQKNGSSDFLTIIDESHVTVPQIRGMYAGDESRKKTLVEHGFRLPSALDNRPLKFPEFQERIGQVIYTSATPSEYEISESRQAAQEAGLKPELGIVEQIIRPTGLLDPMIEIRPVKASSSKNAQAYGGQVADFIVEAEKEIKAGNRVIATTLTKKMAEDLSQFLREKKVKSEYLHSEVKTLERIKILTDFRKGKFDCLVGVNLLREGLDLPEVTFIGILDADKEGFLRSEVSLIQTIGRAARNVDGRVILYAEVITGSMQKAIDETNRRRALQIAYNKKHQITPQSIQKKINDITETLESERARTVGEMLTVDSKLFGGNLKKVIKEKVKQLNEAVKELDFETAAIIRDEIRALEQKA
ncbi:MAG TPA: excinuclease ABC subunit UvrB [Candidatus Paceibacterota bacterium]|nr:excinuclease ABC subunit UvrB [Candidatus Paceibacterota bacterium]